MRVVAGEFGGRRLVTPAGTTTRPTTDKVRLAVFNSLDAAGVIEGAVVVDLFAGCGSLGIEALSRGAAQCTFVERDRDALDALGRNIVALGIAERCRVVRGDVMAIVGTLAGADVVLADPPYGFDAWELLLDRLDAGLVVAESGSELVEYARWSVRRRKQYGRTWVTMLELRSG